VTYYARDFAYDGRTRAVGRREAFICDECEDEMTAPFWCHELRPPHGWIVYVKKRSREALHWCAECAPSRVRRLRKSCART